MIKKLLKKFLTRSKIDLNNVLDCENQIDLDQKGGIGQNTAFHFASTRTNFDILFELDGWGADIFLRHKENKTCF